MTPLSSPQEQREARELAQSIQKSDGVTYTLAWLLLRALAQIEALTAIADPTARRFTAGNHRYPELLAVGLGHLWVGPGFNDFAPGLIEACRKHLKTLNLPAQRGHALDYVRNRIREQNWGALEQRWEEGKPSPPTAPQGGEGSRKLEVLDDSTVPPFGTPAYYAWLEVRRGGSR